MPPSILKYFDVARLIWPAVKCPACNSTHHRPSKWHSKYEKRGSEGLHPYRCIDCATRFLGAKSVPVGRALINYGAAALLGAGIMAAGFISFKSLGAMKPNPSEPAAKVQPIKCIPENELQSRTGEEAPDGREDPADRSGKLRQAATTGDPGAMLKLGLALARGEKTPEELKEAVRWVQLAAAAGNAEGMFELGRFYSEGLGLEQDSVRAYVWLSRAAAANHLAAMQARDKLVRTMSDEKLKEAHELSSSPRSVADKPRLK